MRIKCRSSGGTPEELVHRLKDVISESIQFMQPTSVTKVVANIVTYLLLADSLVGDDNVMILVCICPSADILTHYTNINRLFLGLITGQLLYDLCNQQEGRAGQHNWF